MFYLNMNSAYETALRTLRKFLPRTIRYKGVVVYLFGSRARGDALPTSDIDLGIICENPKHSATIINLLKEQIENSNIPYNVDVVDLSQVSEDFRKKALKESVIIWKN